MEKSEWIWMNGEFVAWDDAKAHVLSHGLHYGTGVFEGIRAYETERGTAIFRHREHLERLEKSAELYYLELPYSADELRGATARSAPIDVMIAVWPWGAYLGEEGKRSGIRAKVSSWRAISADSLIPHAKAAGQYLNSVLAKEESVKAGYDEAILLDPQGGVSEGSGENIFVVRDGVLATPGHVSSILDGISRASVIQIALDLGYPIEERGIARAELYLADEVFLTGTAAELVPIREIDDHPIGEPGEITRHIQNKFDDALFGRAEEYLEWLDIVEQPSVERPSRVTS